MTKYNFHLAHSSFALFNLFFINVYSFLESHPKTTRKKEIRLDILDSNGKEQMIYVRPFVLPFATELSNEDKHLIGGIENLRSKQGFYIYRNKRLIIWGTWFGMKQRAELTKNARISEFSYKLYLKFLCDRLGVGGAAYLGGDRLLA